MESVLSFILFVAFVGAIVVYTNPSLKAWAVNQYKALRARFSKS